MAKRTIYLVTYHRGTYDTTGKVKPYHWSYFIQTKIDGSKSFGIAHQLHGMPGAFYYTGPETVDLNKPNPPKDELEVGEIDESDLPRVHDILKGVRIDKVESSGWNCQDWSLDGFEQLQAAGFVYDYLTKDAVKTWLRET